MAITVMLALGGAFILSLTFVPAMVALLIRGEVAEKDVKAIAFAKERYVPLSTRYAGAAPAVDWRKHWRVRAGGTGLLTLGREFIPQLDEGDIALQGIRIPSTSLNQSLTLQRQIEKAGDHATRGRLYVLEDRDCGSRHRSDACEYL